MNFEEHHDEQRNNESEPHCCRQIKSILQPESWDGNGKNEILGGKKRNQMRLVFDRPIKVWSLMRIL